MSAVKIKKFRVGSLAKVVGVAQAIIAFIYGAIITIAVVAGQITEKSSIVEDLGVSIGVLTFAVLIFPLISYVVGWLQGAIAALILNFVFKESGGLEIEIENLK